MPKIKQLDWSKLKPPTPEKRRTPGTKQFATYEYKEAPKGSKNGAVKITKPPKLPQPYRQEYANNMHHLRNIMKED